MTDTQGKSLVSQAAFSNACCTVHDCGKALIDIIPRPFGHPLSEETRGIVELALSEAVRIETARLIAQRKELREALEMASTALTAQEWRFSHRPSCNTKSRDLDVVLRGCDCDLADTVAAVSAARIALENTKGDEPEFPGGPK